jgi:hypothetical protein
MEQSFMCSSKNSTKDFRKAIKWLTTGSRKKMHVGRQSCALGEIKNSC